MFLIVVVVLVVVVFVVVVFVMVIFVVVVFFGVVFVLVPIQSLRNKVFNQKSPVPMISFPIVSHLMSTVIPQKFIPYQNADKHTNTQTLQLTDLTNQG